MTGLYADQTRIRKNNVYLRSAVPDVVTLSQRFRQRGYEAVRIGKIFHYDNPGTIGTAKSMTAIHGPDDQPLRTGQARGIPHPHPEAETVWGDVELAGDGRHG